MIIPKLLAQHGAVLSGDKSILDMGTAENGLMKDELLRQFQTDSVLDKLSAEVSLNTVIQFGEASLKFLDRTSHMQRASVEVQLQEVLSLV